jgi:hypothetical protein
MSMTLRAMFAPPYQAGPGDQGGTPLGPASDNRAASGSRTETGGTRGSPAAAAYLALRPAITRVQNIRRLSGMVVRVWSKPVGSR